MHQIYRQKIDNEATTNYPRKSFRIKFQQGNFGLEKESQRIDNEGNIVTTPRPAVFRKSCLSPLYSD